MRSLYFRFQNFAQAVLDLLLPPRCSGCGAEEVSAHGLLCTTCFSAISFIREPFCARCGVPFGSAELGPVCGPCQAAPPLFAQARAALRYDEGARRLILPLKHADRTELADVLVPFMVRAAQPLLEQASVLVPVPLHRARLRRRRYNQAALLARGLGRITRRLTVLDALQRIRDTAPLGGKTASERASELAGAFLVRSSRLPAVSGRRVLLVDDVMTSGATANACAAACLSAGASAVDVLAAARVPDPRAG